MPKIVIANVPGLDGEYDLDMNFTHRDFRTIKQVAGIRANEVQDALEAGDLDLVVALAEIALRRSGKEHSVEQLWDAEAGSLTLDGSDLEEADVSPPPQSAEPPSSESESGTSGSSTNGAMDASPETLPLGSSGTPRQVSSSARLTSTT